MPDLVPVVSSGSRGRRARYSLPLILLAVVLALFAAPAFAQITVSPNAACTPLPGSNFQGCDGDQLDHTPYIDWQSLAAVGRVTTISDPSGQNADDVFTGGSKEDAPVDWRIVTGNVPPKDNIFTAWASADQTPSATFLYLAFVRESPNGNTYLTFELNQSSATYVNANGDTVPCRTTGDLLISYEVTPNPQGGDVQIVVYQWTGNAPTDPSLGCPEGQTGTLTPLATSNVQAAMNFFGDIANFLPTNAPYDGTFPAGTFGEASINLTALLAQAGVSPCLNFVQVWAHSRAAVEINSELKDFLAPVSFPLRNCTASGTKFFDQNGDGARQTGEPGLAGWVFYVDINDNGVRDPGEPTATSDANGNFTIGGVNAGTFKIREELQPGWICTFPTPNCFYTRTFLAGGNDVGNLFGNAHPTNNPPPPPPPQPGQPTPPPPPPPSGGGQSPETVVPGSSNAVGPERCVQRTFAIRVAGRNIDRVVFFIDNKRVKTVTQPDRLGRFVLRVDVTRYNRKTHKVRAQVFFTAQSRTASKTHRLTFHRCKKAVIKPKFTG